MHDFKVSTSDFVKLSPRNRLRQLRWPLSIMNVVTLLAGVMAIYLWYEREHREEHEFNVFFDIASQITDDQQKQFGLMVEALELDTFEEQREHLRKLLDKKKTGEELELKSPREFFQEQLELNNAPPDGASRLRRPNQTLATHPVDIRRTVMGSSTLIFAQSSNPVSIGTIVWLVLIVLLLVYVGLLVIVILSEKEDTIEFAKDLIKTFTGFFIGIVTGLLGV